jgi:hypothetical protein
VAGFGQLPGGSSSYAGPVAAVPALSEPASTRGPTPSKVISQSVGSTSAGSVGDAVADPEATGSVAGEVVEDAEVLTASGGVVDEQPARTIAIDTRPMPTRIRRWRSVVRMDTDEV